VNVDSVEASIPLDLEPERLASRIGGWDRPAFLESGPGFGKAGRWSIFAAEPRLVVEATDRTVRVSREGGEETAGEDPLGELARLLSAYRLANPADVPEAGAPPFRGGMIGYLGYDLAPLLERLPRRLGRDSRLPDLRFGLYDTWVEVDHQTGRVEVRAADLVGEGTSAVWGRLKSWRDRLRAPAPPLGRTELDTPVHGEFSPEAYLNAVERALEYIRAGDIFQVNLSQRFSARGSLVPLDLHLRLRSVSPAPFSAFLAWDDLAIVSASPEWFHQTRGDRIVTRPIKGTRPRGRTIEEDQKLARELIASPKDRAELTMIVDLERNDLGRVCRYGSVQVSEPLVIESFAQVHHLVATVEGRLRAGVGPVDIIEAMFPGGSITGAPKIRAMEIIDELEPTRRSAYTGSFGYFSRGGTSGFNIMIRTLLVEGDRVSYQVGGGIVTDSDPAAEYAETLHKGRGLRAALETGGDRWR
jgi:para-aminobenzoate synthetase component 1